jgi:hypothetical protein
MLIFFPIMQAEAWIRPVDVRVGTGLYSESATSLAICNPNIVEQQNPCWIFASAYLIKNASS